MARSNLELRAFIPGDTMVLRDVFAASVEELTQEEYTEDQRIAWVSIAEDAATFCKLLENGVTLVVEVNGELAGFASLKDNHILDMLYVHPHHADEGIGTMLCEALETVAKTSGESEIVAESTETAVLFFEGRGYKALQRNSLQRFGEWLTTTTLKKVF